YEQARQAADVLLRAAAPGDLNQDEADPATFVEKATRLDSPQFLVRMYADPNEPRDGAIEVLDDAIAGQGAADSTPLVEMMGAEMLLRLRRNLGGQPLSEEQEMRIEEIHERLAKYESQIAWERSK